jgi:hypothetical protein
MKKILVIGIICLFIGVGIHPAFAVDTRQSFVADEDKENKHYVDPNLHLNRNHLPVLKRSLNYYRQSDDRDVEIEEVVEGIITLIEVKGEVNSEDVEIILLKSSSKPFNIYTFCSITGTAEFCDIDIRPVPLLFFTLLTGFIIGIGGYFAWDAWDYMGYYIKMTVGHTTYTKSHTGISFGFFGRGYYDYYPDPREPDQLDINGFALLAIVK